MGEGVSYLVCDHEKPVAVLSPVQGVGEDVCRRNLAAMEKSGLVRRGSGKLPADFFCGELPASRSGASVVDALLEEREDGR